MAWQWTIDSKAAKSLKKLPREVSLRISHKLDFWCESNFPLVFAENLHDFDLGSYRFRIGDYRVTFDVEAETIVVLAVGHRRDIYK